MISKNAILFKQFTLTLLALTALPSFAAPPTPDMSNLPAYLQELKQSPDPESAQILNEITSGPEALAQQEKLAEAAGIPLPQAQTAQTMPPANENAAPLYQKLQVLLKSDPVTLPQYAQPLQYGFAYTPKQLAAVQHVIDDRQDVFGLTDQAARLPDCAAPDGPGITGFGNLPLYPKLREAARAIATQSYLLASQGKYAQAIQMQALGYNIGQQAADTGSFMADLVALNIDRVTTDGMHAILYMAGPNATVDKQVRQAISAHPVSLSLQTALQSQAVIVFSLMETLAKVDAASGDKTSAQIYQDITDAVEARYLAYMRPMMIAAGQPGMTRNKLITALSVKADVGTAAEQAINPIDALFSKLAATNYSQFVNSFDVPVASAEVTMAATAALASEAKTGTCPIHLPGTFIDPFNGKPLKYRCEGNIGFVVYSVGPSGLFAGGRAGQYKFKTLEIFFRYPGPPLRPVPSNQIYAPKQ